MSAARALGVTHDVRRVAPTVGAVLLLAVGVAAAATPTLSFEEVRPGMRGTGRTVFEGTEVSTFDVEILGKLPNIGPDQNLILARLSGGPLDRTGVLAGMSGSPVHVEGKLIGAVAYSWSFATEPVAGITPIEEMLQLRGSGDATAGRPRASVAGVGAYRGWPTPERLADTLAGLERRLAAGGRARLPLPLSVAGFGPAGFASVAADLDRAGFVALQTGATGGDGEPAVALVPGSAMGLKLVRGDVDLTATGTVTWIEGERLLGFGHPLFGLGRIDLPLTAARVEALLPSALQSARIARPLGEVGAARQDRAAGIAASIGATPRMIPVWLELSGPDDSTHAFAFDVADDPLLSPLLLYVSLKGVLASKERAFGSATLRLREGSLIQLVGHDDIELDNLYAGSTAFDYGTGIAAYVLHLLMNNTWTAPQIAGVNLRMEYEETPRLARIRRAALDRYRVLAGESIEVTVVLSPFRGPDRLVTREIVVPEETPPGTLTVSIGGALAVSQDRELDAPVHPHGLDQLIWLINQLRRNDRIHILATREDTGVLLGGDRMPNLPPSVARVLTRPRNEGDVTSIPWRSVLEEAVRTEHAVEGLARIRLEVESR